MPNQQPESSTDTSSETYSEAFAETSAAAPAIKAIDAQHVDNGVDRVNLKQLSQRFTQINQLRLARLHSALSHSQQIFIDLLPLLFHINHPVLPGYMPTGTAVGLRNFKPTRESIKSARILAKSFALKRELNPPSDICGVYLMGSCGTIAHSNASDIDIWVCPSTDLAQEQRVTLKEKCRLISQWAASLKLEVHFFVMDEVEFKQKHRAEMDGEDCGNTQHYLLLDEFYRTGILIGGCLPIWWLVPDEFENEYQHFVDTLKEKRFVDPDTHIDYGSAKTIPTEEYVSAGIWQLYKSLASPYKSALKLLLIEVYASEHPHTENLSSQYKRLVYSGDYDSDELDPYVLIYRKIEKYLLAKQDTHRLELMRRCLYFKVGVALSQNVTNDATLITTAGNASKTATEQLNQNDTDHSRWQRRVMQKLCSEWGWTNNYIQHLDKRQHWPLAEIKAEQNKLTKQLTQSYRLFTSLNPQDGNQTADTQSNTQRRHHSRELTLLGRQLYAAFERKSNKILRLQQGIVNTLAQPHIVFGAQQSEADSNILVWTASSDLLGSKPQATTDSVDSNGSGNATSDNRHQIIKESDNPVELLAWCISNDIVNADTRINIDGGNHDLSDYEIRQLQGFLLQNLQSDRHKNQTESASDIFARPAKVEKCLFIINAGIDPLKNQKDSGIQRISDKTDPLAFSGVQENLIANITHIAINSWGEVFSYHFSGDDAIDQCLSHYFCYTKPDSDEALPERFICCACPTRPTAITERVENLFDDIADCYFDQAQASNADNTITNSFATNAYNESKRYIFESANAYHVLSWEDGNPKINQYTSDTILFNSLADPDTAGPVVIDRFALTGHPLNTIYRTAEASSKKMSASASRAGAHSNTIRIFYQVNGQHADTYLLDSNQSLFIANIPFESTRSFILPLSRFIERSELRRFDTLKQSLDTDSLNGNGDSITDNDGNYVFEKPQLEFYAISKTATGYSSRQVPTESEISANYLPIEAVGKRSLVGEIDWSIACNEQRFDSSNHGADLFEQVAQAIKQHRKSGQSRYRCYITDIDISACLSKPDLAHELYHKLQLEDAINNAFKQLED